MQTPRPARADPGPGAPPKWPVRCGRSRPHSAFGPLWNPAARTPRPPRCSPERRGLRDAPRHRASSAAANARPAPSPGPRPCGAHVHWALGADCAPPNERGSHARHPALCSSPPQLSPFPPMNDRAGRRRILANPGTAAATKCSPFSFLPSLKRPSFETAVKVFSDKCLFGSAPPTKCLCGIRSPVRPAWRLPQGPCLLTQSLNHRIPVITCGKRQRRIHSLRLFLIYDVNFSRSVKHRSLHLHNEGVNSSAFQQRVISGSRG